MYLIVILIEILLGNVLRLSPSMTSFYFGIYLKEKGQNRRFLFFFLSVASLLRFQLEFLQRRSSLQSENNLGTNSKLYHIHIVICKSSEIKQNIRDQIPYLLLKFPSISLYFHWHIYRLPLLFQMHKQCISFHSLF